ncbi:MAG: BrnT family toxin [Chloroflexi bacterium]|nr:MAG: BrnT family toxin [Chloroflexota bacterium]
MRFEWDVQKAAVNRTKHGISFEEAITAFDDPFALVAPDPRHSATEEERLADSGGPRHLGRRLHDPAARQHVPTHQHTPRESARERKRYEEAKRVPL